MKKNLLLLLTSILLASCNSELSDEYVDVLQESTSNSTSYKISPEEAVESINSFMESIDAYNVKTRGAYGKQVSSVFAIRNEVKTRSTSNEATTQMPYDGIDTLMYVVNFSNDEGFAIVAADKRTSPIFAIVDEGTFSIDNLTEDIDEGFLSFIDDAISMEIKDINAHNDECQTRSLVTKGYTISELYSPILHTKWTQQDVYGQYCPNGIAGCAILATAQILSHFKCINHVNWSYNGTYGGSDIHWNQIIADCDTHNGKLTSASCSTSANEIAHLVRYLGIAMDADYKSNSTGVGESKAIDWFNDWSGLNATKLRDYDEFQIIEAIKQGLPVYARGNSGKKKILGIRVGWKGGHAWVYDGALVATKDGKSNNFVHCNWGWGGDKNGYYLSNAFDTNKGAEIFDYSDSQYGSSSNYQYHLQYSIISVK